jgi:hypothetical protein
VVAEPDPDRGLVHLAAPAGRQHQGDRADHPAGGSRGGTRHRVQSWRR